MIAQYFPDCTMILQLLDDSATAQLFPDHSTLPESLFVSRLCTTKTLEIPGQRKRDRLFDEDYVSAAGEVFNYSRDYHVLNFVPI
jgi:hypothetical protein